MADEAYSELEQLDPRDDLWSRIYTVAPLVLVGTEDSDGSPDIAPKHMAFPLGWDNYFGFVCTPRHATYANIERRGSFTVSYPRPAAVVATSLTASPRCEDGKPIVGLLETFPARTANGVFVKGSYLYLECRLKEIVDGFGANSLIAGEIIAAYADPAALRTSDRDDADLLVQAPQLAYLYPGRFAIIDRTQAFPFPAGMQR